MSLRNRIVVLLLMLALMTPVSAWAKAGTIDPDGQQLESADTVSSIRVVGSSAGSPPSLDSYDAAVGAQPDRTSIQGLFDRFLAWLQAMVQPL